MSWLCHANCKISTCDLWWHCILLPELQRILNWSFILYIADKSEEIFSALNHWPSSFAILILKNFLVAFCRPIYILTKSASTSLSLTTSVTMVCHLYIVVLTGLRWQLIMYLGCTCLNIHDVQCFSPQILANRMPSFAKYLLGFLVLFFEIEFKFIMRF